MKWVTGPQAGAPVGRRAVAWPGPLRALGAMVHLAGQVVVRSVKPPVSYGAEFMTQFRFALGISLLPLILISFALSYGPAGIQASNFLGLFGALDRLGAAYELIVIREFAPLLTAITVAGVVGTAMCADLGARKVREETDALSVLGVDIIQALVVPRFLAIVAISVLFDVFALIGGMAGALLVVYQAHQPVGPFLATFFANATPLEFGASLVKTGVYGGMIAIVSCYKGLTTSGGAEGVGRSVNQTVVIAFLMIGAIDYAFTQYLLATHPILSATR